MRELQAKQKSTKKILKISRQNQQIASTEFITSLPIRPSIYVCSTAQFTLIWTLLLHTPPFFPRQLSVLCNAAGQPAGGTWICISWIQEISLIT